MAVYEWGSALRTSGRGITLNAELDAQKTGEALEKLRNKHGGEFQAEDVVAAAQSNRHPLHKAFEWDDEIAGPKYREEQAKLLVRSVVVKVETSEGSEPARAFVKVRSENDGNGMSSIEAAMSDPDSRDYVLQQALNQLRSWRRKWATLSRYADATEAIQSIDHGIRVLQNASAD